MSIFSDVMGGLFGGGGDAAKDQLKANKESQTYTKEQAAQARNDAIGLYNASSYPLKDGYQAALDAVGGTTRQQIDTTARGNYYGQEALLAGMPQFQNAILGLPVDNSKLQPRILHPEANLGWMWNSDVGQRTGGHKPWEGLTDNDKLALKTMHEAGLSNQQIGDLAKWGMGVPTQKPLTETSGAAAQAKALFDAGLLSGKQYKQIQQQMQKKAGG
jgi:hypothetical protein